MTGSQIVRWQDLSAWLPGHAAAWTSDAPLVPLGDVLSPRAEPVSDTDFPNYSPITIRFDGSVVPRDRTLPFVGRMYAVHPGDLVFSKIDVRNGAIGLLPAGIERGVVTPEYPVYVPSPDDVDAAYLALLLRTPQFGAALRGAASGTSGRKRVSPQAFEALEVPLPSVEDQRRLVAAHAAAVAEADALDDEAGRVEAAAVKAFEAALGLAPPPELPRVRSRVARWSELDRWSHEGALQASIGDDHMAGARYPMVRLGEVARVSYGLQKSPANRPEKHARPYLRVANVQRGVLDLREIKMIDVPDDDMPKYSLEAGDLLFVEGNGSRSEIGRAALWTGEIDGCVHQNHLICARLDHSEVDPEFVMEWFATESGKEHFLRNAKTTSGLFTLNSSDIRTAPIPIPDSVSAQRALVLKLRSERAKATGMRTEAARGRVRASEMFAGAVFG